MGKIRSMIPVDDEDTKTTTTTATRENKKGKKITTNFSMTSLQYFVITNSTLLMIDSGSISG
jgi:hypothetical protein